MKSAPAREEKGAPEMKCKECKKKIVFDHYLAGNQPVQGKETLYLVFKCDCGSYVIPMDLVETSEFKGLVSSGTIRYCKLAEDRHMDGEKLSREAKKIYQEQGEAAYERWKKEVYFPLMDARAKRLKGNRFRKRA